MCVRVRAHLSAHQLRGPGGYPGSCKDHHQLSRDGMFCSYQHSLRRDSRGDRQTPSTGRISKDRGTKEAGRGQVTQTPGITILTSPRSRFPAQSQRAEGAWRSLPRRPSLAPEACPLHSPSWPQARFSLVRQRREPGAVTLKQAVTMVINANPLSAP